MPQRRDRIARLLDGDRPDAPFASRLATGALVGAFFAVFVPVILILWAIGGRETVIKGTTVRLDLLTAIYPLGAVLSSALLYALAPLSPSRVLRALLGAIAFVPWFAGIAWCSDGGYATWRSKHTAVTIISALAIGAPLGWNTTPKRKQRGDRASRRSAV